MKSRHPFWVDTSSGSRYHLDPVAGTWSRVSHDPRSDGLRNEGGALESHTRPRVGLSLVITEPSPFIPGLTRIIHTTPVTKVWRTAPPTEAPEPAPGWWDGYEEDEA